MSPHMDDSIQFCAQYDLKPDLELAKQIETQVRLWRPIQADDDQEDWSVSDWWFFKLDEEDRSDFEHIELGPRDREAESVTGIPPTHRMGPKLRAGLKHVRAEFLVPVFEDCGLLIRKDLEHIKQWLDEDRTFRSTLRKALGFGEEATNWYRVLAFIGWPSKWGTHDWEPSCPDPPSEPSASRLHSKVVYTSARWAL
ncbi:hypothetical protein BDZ89DRAFT_1142026 [Hymenopellis radicata]|nr:hypothetical protein BDZ89DRAFT_1142026 [Hymenopellis radicata]